IENTVQIQINSYMQIEYHNSSNILFGFICLNEKFQFQLGIHLPITKKIFVLTKRSNSIISNNSSNIPDKQQRKLSIIQNYYHQLPSMQDLIILRKRIKHICDNWLKECRTILGKINNLFIKNSNHCFFLKVL